MRPILFGSVMCVALSGCSQWCDDDDRDGLGDPTDCVSALTRDYNADGLPDGGYEDYVNNDEDCDDADASVGSDPYTWYVDDDGDGFGNEAVSACDPLPTMGYSLFAGDCDDAAAWVYPGTISIASTMVNTYATIQEAVDAATDGDTVQACGITDLAGVTIDGRSDLTVEGYNTSWVAEAPQSCVMVYASTNIAFNGLDLYNCHAEGATATPYGDTNNKGGCAWVRDSNVSFADLSAQYCDADEDGGGLFINDSVVTLTEVDLVGNDPDDPGGNLTVRGTTQIVMTGGSVTDAPDHHGVYVYDRDSGSSTTTVEFADVYFDGNTSYDVQFESGPYYTFGGSYTGTCAAASATCP